ncbi:hypothetical protein ALC56_04106, partial [Trachymyrmex septentrionalis]
RKKHEARSDRVRTLHFVQQVQGIIDEDSSKFIRAIYIYISSSCKKHFFLMHRL